MGRQATELASVALAVAISASPALADPKTSVESAFRLCAIFDGMGMLSDKCKISGWNSSVEISLDTSGPNATKICADMAKNVAQVGLSFDGQWQLKIYSPFSGGRTVAVCSLR